MTGLKLKLDEETLDALERRAQSERRPLDWQAEVLLRQSLGLPFPIPNPMGSDTSASHGSQDVGSDS